MTIPLDESSPATVVEARQLTKRYRSGVVAVTEVSFAVRRGEIYGFLGPNGAGKTTTLRMLLGLIRPSAGTAHVLGRTAGSPAALARVGAMVETPSFYPYLSGRNNLRVLARYAGVVEHRITSVLGTVELTDRADEPFQRYSLGMKQRLGVAAALLKEPELLLLDEPTNGLDPEGMADMRVLIRRLRDQGRAVLLSSHLLGEVEQICDRIGVIADGQLLQESTVDDIRGGRRLLVKATPAEAAASVLTAALGVHRVTTTDGGVRCEADESDAAELNRRLVAAGIDVHGLRAEERSLEEAFLTLVNGRRP